MTVRIYTQEYKELLESIFANQAEFGNFFGGGIETLDGVSTGDVAFTVKTTDIPMVIREYNTGANVGMGSGTSNSSRYGEMTEIKSSTKDVNYTGTWSVNEGMDKFTSNEALDVLAADRLELLAQEKVELFNKSQAKFISESAGETKELGGYTNEDVVKLFNDLSKYFTNKRTFGTKIAKVNPDLYNAIVDHPLVSTRKNSNVNIDTGEVTMFKGFVIEELADDLFQEGEVAYAYIANIGKAFVGFDDTRVLTVHPDFSGMALQSAGKFGEYVPEANKAGIVKVTGAEGNDTP